MTKRDSKTKPSVRKERKDPLAIYRQQAAPIVRLYFAGSTPAFVRDLLSSWLTSLENNFQIFWNRREVLEVALPIMLARADEEGLDVFGLNGFYVSALRESIGCIETGEQISREPTAREILTAELQRDANALAQLLNSRHIPPAVLDVLSESVLTFMDSHNTQPEVLRAQWPLAVLATMEGEA
jgi:hypothetical protein